MRLLRLWLPVLLWAVVILAASSDLFAFKRSRGWLQRASGHDVPLWIHHSIRKGGHVFEYGVLGALALRAARGTWSRRTRGAWAVTLLITLAVASADEISQSRSKWRRGAPDDVLLDVSAAALVMAVMERRRATGDGRRA